MKISELGKLAWPRIERTLEAGEHPRMGAIIDALRDEKTGPVPKEIRNYLADLLEGRKNRPRGRPTSSVSEKFWAQSMRSYWAHRVFRWKRVIEKRYHQPDAYHAALEKVSKESEIPESTLDKYCYPRRKRS